MLVRIGTSGFSYAEWKGSFYPPELKAAGMLRYYAERLSTVEINSTFYRMPRADVVAGWYEQVPAGFQFVLKANQRITHQQRLKDSVDSVAYLFKVIEILKDKLGPVLFQLPPNMQKDAERLRDFLANMPEGCRAAFEFRHASWFCDEVFDILKQRDAALCCGDVDEPAVSSPFVTTASFNYVRLRRSDYGDADLQQWAARLTESARDAYVFLKHEVAAPELCRRLASCFAPGIVPQTALADALADADADADADAAPTGPGSAKTRPRRPQSGVVKAAAQSDSARRAPARRRAR